MLVDNLMHLFEYAEAPPGDYQMTIILQLSVFEACKRFILVTSKRRLPDESHIPMRYHTILVLLESS